MRLLKNHLKHLAFMHLKIPGTATVMLPLTPGSIVIVVDPKTWLFCETSISLPSLFITMVTNRRIRKAIIVIGKLLI